VVPALVCFELADGYENTLCLGVYALGIALWFAGKRYCLQCTKGHKSRHVDA